MRPRVRWAVGTPDGLDQCQRLSGLGWIKPRVDDPDQLFDVNSNDWGLNVGGGVAGFFTDNFGLQGDVRYFRSLQDNEPDDEFDVALGSFHFWRGSVGATFRF